MFTFLNNDSHAVPFSGHVKLIFTDIDGTFVNLEKHINPAVRDAARATIARGMSLAFATGRNFNAVKHWIAELGMTAPQIINNGAEIVRPQDGSFIMQRFFRQETVRWLFREGMSRGLRPLVCRENLIFSTHHAHADWMLLRNNEPVTVIPEAEMLAQPCEKVAFIEEEDMQPTLEAFAEDLAAMEKPAGMDFKPTFTEIGILVVSPPGVGKLDAIRLLCEQHGCTVNDVMAIGDGDNDAEMLAGVGCAVAMGNAMPKALAAARFQVSDNVHDGAIEALQFAWEHP